MFVLRRRGDDRLSEEIQAHLELLTAERMQQGLSADDARAAARRTFGGVEQVKEEYRDQRGLLGSDTWEARYAVTSLAVSQRTQEIGVRMALGARRWHVIWFVARRVAFHLSVGLAVGIACTRVWGSLFSTGRADITVERSAVARRGRRDPDHHRRDRMLCSGAACDAPRSGRGNSSRLTPAPPGQRGNGGQISIF